MANILKDRAIENQWITTDDFNWLSITPPPSSKLVKRSTDTLGAKNSKLSGNIVYFIAKNPKGKVIGKPVRLLNVGGKYIDGKYVEPYYESILKNKEYWEVKGAYDLIALAQQKVQGAGILASKFSGFNGQTLIPAKNRFDGGNSVDLLNSNFLVEHVVQEHSPNGYPRNAYFDISYGVDGKRRNLLIGNDENTSRVYRNKNYYATSNFHAGYEDSGALKNYSDMFIKTGNPQDEFDLMFGVNGKNNLVPAKVPTAYGIDAQPAIDLGVDGKRVNYSNVLATPHNTFEIQFGVTGDGGLADPSKQIYTVDELEEIYKKSGTKKTFKDWLASDSGKKLVDTLNNIVSIFGGAKPPSTTAPPSSEKEKEDKDDKGETTILGMTPLTFGIVALLGVATIATAVVVYNMSKGKGKKVIPTT